MYGLGNGRTALSHGAAITTYTADTVLPPLAVFAVALALVDELAELSAPLFVLDLEGRQASHYIIAVG